MANALYEYVTCRGLVLIHRIADGAWIPRDLLNCDYIKFTEYLNSTDSKQIKTISYDTKPKD